MMNAGQIMLRPPYLLFLGDLEERAYAKTALGVLDWRPEVCAGQHRLPGCPVDLGLSDMSLEEAAAAGVGSLVIGAAAVGGRLPPAWLPTLEAALEAGIDVVSGLHDRLAGLPTLVNAAGRAGARIIDVRVPPKDIPVGTGRKRSGFRLLTVGTDCAVGKKYTALAIAAALKERGVGATFRASGQTGIIISGSGMPMDAVVSDFLSGAAEVLSPDAEEGHWDVIEGQGSLFHPSYAAVSHGLLIGSQPDAFVVCHEAGRDMIADVEGYPTPSLTDCIAYNRQIASLTNREAICIGISINTSLAPPGERKAILQRAEEETGLPCVDPLAGGVAPIISELISHFGGGV